MKKVNVIFSKGFEAYDAGFEYQQYHYLYDGDIEVGDFCTVVVNNNGYRQLSIVRIIEVLDDITSNFRLKMIHQKIKGFRTCQ